MEERKSNSKDRQLKTPASDARVDPQSSILDPRSPAFATPVAIIGMGCMFPKAADLGQYWSNIQNGVDAITEVPATHWRPEDYLDPNPKAADRTYTSRGGFLSPVDFPPLDFGISPNSLEAIDTTQLLGLMVARQALEDAGYGPDRPFDRDRVSVILGVTGTLELVIPLGARLGHPIWRRALQAAGVEESVAQDVIERISASYVGWQEDSFPGLLGNVVAGRIANRLDLGGTNCVVDAACASSLSALHLAVLELASGRCDMVITGGLDTFNDIFMYMCFSKTPALSPTGNARPFDAKADGTILGEGLGILVLKRLEDAERDGDRMYAVIKSIGSSSDGKGQAIYAPRPEGQAKALRQAYRLADLTPDTIELVEAHGTGTRAGDAAELQALTEVFQEAAGQQGSSWCALGSVKSQIGHTKAAAGAAGLIKATLALHHKVLPPTIKVDQPIEALSQSRTPFYLNRQTRPWVARGHRPRRAAVSSFGFGGSNFHCVLEEYQPKMANITSDGDVQIVAFSANQREELLAKLNAWPQSLAREDLRDEAARSRTGFQTDHNFRLALVLKGDNISGLIGTVQAMLENHPEKQTWSTPSGIYFASGPRPGKLALLFPGQGSQYVGMFRDLACQFPQMQEALEEANAAWLAAEGIEDRRRLSDFIYPHSAFTEEDRRPNEEALRATEVAQPAIGAVSLGALRILEYFGVRPDAVAGHSYGELVALCAGGRFDSTSLHSLSLLRGRLMTEAGRRTANPRDLICAPVGDRGDMLAVRAGLETVLQVIAEEKLDIVVANKNAPEQFVLSGSSSEIIRAEESFARRAIESHRLPVSAAFHSSFVADVRQAFRAGLEEVPFSLGSIPVFSNTTGREYPNQPPEVRELLAGQLAQPVEFIEEIGEMYQTGVRTFVEVGPANKLSGLVAAILKDREHQTLALDASSGKHPGAYDLARVLAQLTVLGYPIQLAKWDETSGQRTKKRKPALTIPICGANYVRRESGARGDAAMNRSGEDKTIENRKKTVLQPANVCPESLSAPSRHPPATEASPELAGILRATQENLLALQKLGEQTAQLHRLFLEGQDRALQAFQSLFQQQQQLTGTFLGRHAPASTSGSPSSDATGPHTARSIEASGDGATVSAPPVLQPNSLPRAERALTERGDGSTDIAAGPTNGQARHILLEVVSEKTGYPAEMLELDMELDSDLGIDSIKRVEIFSALQERLPQAPQIKSDHLGTLRTLRQIIDFLNTSSNGEVNSRAAQTTCASDWEHLPEEAARKILLEVVAEKTGYPAEMLELDMELDSDLGIDSIKRVEIFSSLQERLPQAPAVKTEHLGSLRTLRQIVDFLASAKPHPVSLAGSTEGKEDASPAPRNIREQRSPVTRTVSEGASTNSHLHASPASVRRLVPVIQPIEKEDRRRQVDIPNGVEIWITKDSSNLPDCLTRLLEAKGYCPKLVDIDPTAPLPQCPLLSGLIILSPASEVEDEFLRQAFQLLQRAGPALRRGGEAQGSIFVTVSRMDGSFGLNSVDLAQLSGENGRQDSLSNPISGGLAGLAKTAAKEWPEVRVKALDLAAILDDSRAASAIVDEMFAAGPLEVGICAKGKCTVHLEETPHINGHSPLTQSDLVLLSGGARGITAEAAVALAHAFRPTLVLLGRSPEPDSEPDWLMNLTDEAQIKRALLAHSQGKMSPKEIEEHYRQTMAKREIRRNLQRIKTAGADVFYRSVDVRDPEAVKGVMAEMRHRLGPVRCLIHGVGVLADRRIEDKTPEQFELVYATKVQGLRNLLQFLDTDHLRLLILFSSLSARLGRAGQADYAIANEVLNKLAQHEARRRPNCRVVSVNWGPWDGGMVTPSVRKLFESEGAGLIPLEAGAQYLVREISQESDRAVEVVVLADNSSLKEAPLGNGKIDDKPAVTTHHPPLTTHHAPLTLAFELELTVERFPFLMSHVIDGHAVLPLAITMEWLAHGALHSNPGLIFHGCDELRVLKGVILKGDEPYPLGVFTGKPVKEGAYYRVPVEMRARPGGRVNSPWRETMHSRAEIILAEKLPHGGHQVPGIVGDAYSRDKEEIYSEVLFHGPDFQGIERIDGCSEHGIVGLVSAAPPPSAWIHRPFRNVWLADPLVIDSAFQLMVLWSFERFGSVSLPCFLGRYRQYQRSFPKDACRVMAIVREMATQRAKADIIVQDAAGNVIARMENYECVVDRKLNGAFRRNRLSEEALPTT